MYISFLRNLFHEINFSDVLLLTITGQQQNTAIFSLSHNKPTDFFPVPPPNSTHSKLHLNSAEPQQEIARLSTLSRETRNLTQQSEKPSEIYRRNDEILVKPQILRNLGNQS